MMTILLLLAAQAVPEERPTVLATLPTLGAIVREVAGDHVEVVDLARGDEDPHFVQATPELQRAASRAVAMFEVGMRLELWADYVARFVPDRIAVSNHPEMYPLEVPTRVSAAEGDIHPQGNPHIWLSPVRAKLMARRVEEELSRLFPAHADAFQANLESFENRVNVALYGQDLIDFVGVNSLDRMVLRGNLFERMERAGATERIGGWLARAARLRGMRVVEYHKVWAYFAQTFGMEIAGVIEEYPGIRPGPTHLREITDVVRGGAGLIMVDNFYERDLPDHIAEEGGGAVAVLPSQVRGEEGVDDYFALIDRILTRLEEALPDE